MKYRHRGALLFTGLGILAVATAVAAAYWWFSAGTVSAAPLLFVSTVSGPDGRIGEPFGISVHNEEVFVSDGQNGTILRLSGGDLSVFASGLDTPSGITHATNGGLIVADSGTSTIRWIDPSGTISTVAGVAGTRGFADGRTTNALFNSPSGVAVVGERIFITDTYNDRIRYIENGDVGTFAGGERGFKDGRGFSAQFDAPTGIAVWMDKLIVADTGNRRIRVIEPNGFVWTLAGTGAADVIDGSLASAAFYQPTGIALTGAGAIVVTDGGSVRLIGGLIPAVRTLTGKGRGVADGPVHRAQFNRISGVAAAADGSLLLADSENRLVRRLSANPGGREISPAERESLRDDQAAFRAAAAPRWPYDPPQARRDVAGTLGEIRGLMTDTAEDVWFHNGLDIAGAYGETARFIRDEKVLRPVAAENFGTLRELVRMPTLGYIHIRLGRDKDSQPYEDPRFQFSRDPSGKLVDVRIPRGASFRAGEPIGTLNAMNHVHLIAGRSGSEMNALAALDLPGISDSRPPVIEKVTIYDQNWVAVETVSADSRINLTGNLRIVVKAYDQVDGNSERRRLGIYKAGYQILRADQSPLTEERWNIVFDRMPSNDLVRLAYANGSHSGATGETIFNYIVTNKLGAESAGEAFLETGSIAEGNYILRTLAGDYFGNITSKDIQVTIKR